MTGSFCNSCDLFIELNIFVERDYKCLHILCLWHPLISFPAKLAKLSPPSFSSSQPKKWSPTRFSSTRRTFDPFMTSWLQALSSLWYLFLSVANNSLSTSKLIGFRQPQRIFSSLSFLKKQNWDSSGISHFNISSSILWFKIWRPNLWSQITNGLSGGIYENICFVHSPLKKSRVLNTYIILFYLSMHQESLVFLSNRKIDFSDLWSLSP